MSFKLKPAALAVALALPTLAVGAEETRLTPVVVAAPKIAAEPAGAAKVDAADLASMRPATSDAAQLLQDVPGVSLYTAGGVSSLPAIHGLADDRLRIKVDGMDFIASCPNHMNSPLSYVDPSAVGRVKVYTGIAPVSVGGDSIGGAVVVDSAAPVFAAPGQGSLIQGEAGAFYRSNGNAQGANVAATFATESLSVTYTGATAESENYKAARDFKSFTDTARPGHELPRNEVGSTAYKTRNQTLGFAMKTGDQLVEVKFAYQDIPYELYPNQRMDMLGNTQHSTNLRYLGQFDWGKVEARAYHQTVDHYMDFGADKKFNYGTITGTSGKVWSVDGMPMYTASKTEGAAVKADIVLSQRDLLRVGAELQTYRLDDWWPPSPNCGSDCSGGMAPLAFWNINDGKRDRQGVFGEWEAQWNPAWRSLVGVRFEHVTTDAGRVQGYNTGSMYTGSSVGSTDAFNAMSRKRSDNNVDFTALLSHTPDGASRYDFGYAQKTRSPNLYERYSWSTNAMALEMNNFVGDGNGYVGNPDLKPEVAHTLSLTGNWHSADGETELEVTPYYSRVTDYIDAVRRPNAVNMKMVSDQNTTLTNGFVKLQYANQTARLYGIDLSGRMPLARTSYGDWSLKGLINYTRGKNLDTNDDLYNIMPLNAKLRLIEKTGSWTNSAEVQWVDAKTHVSDVRNEVQTASYTLVNLRSSYEWSKVRLDVGIDNLLNRFYYLPLGGAYVGQGSTMSLNKEIGGATLWGIPVPGMGRSLYLGLNFKF